MAPSAKVEPGVSVEEAAPAEEITSGRTAYQRLNDLRAELGGVSKNKKNDHFKSKYADINAILDQINDLMVKHDLTFIQTTGPNYGVEDIAARYPYVTTTKLIDSRTGKLIEQMTYPIISKDYTDPQKVGSGQTYARRYSLLTLLGLGTDDDDGNAAAAPKKSDGGAVVPTKTELIKQVKTTLGVETPEDLKRVTEEVYGAGKGVSSFNDLDATQLTTLVNSKNAPPF